jgi:hypothetical protein
MVAGGDGAGSRRRGQVADLGDHGLVVDGELVAAVAEVDRLDVVRRRAAQPHEPDHLVQRVVGLDAPPFCQKDSPVNCTSATGFRLMSDS